MRHRKKSDEKPTKIQPLRGYIETRFVKCGRPNCKCSKGELHGPYYLRRWIRDGRKVSKYVKNCEKQSVFAAVSTYKQERFEQRLARDRNRELLREIDQNSKHLQFLIKLLDQGAIKL